jgi:FAD/FMN-containing dehydrogenase
MIRRNARCEAPRQRGSDGGAREGSPDRGPSGAPGTAGVTAALHSRFATTAISGDGIATIFRNLRAWPGTSVAATWKYFLMGGVLNDKRATDMAFVHRGATMITSIELEWNPGDDGALLQKNFRWLDAFHDEMATYTSASSYQNFIDRRQTNYLDAYYGSNIGRLMQVKRQVDPNNVFTYPQAIPLRWS